MARKEIVEVLRRLDAESLAELVRLAEKLGIPSTK